MDPNKKKIPFKPSFQVFAIFPLSSQTNSLFKKPYVYIIFVIRLFLHRKILNILKYCSIFVLNHVVSLEDLILFFFWFLFNFMKKKNDFFSSFSTKGAFVSPSARILPSLFAELYFWRILG